MGHIYDEVSSISPLLSEYDSLSNDELHEIAVEELEEECTAAFIFSYKNNDLLKFSQNILLMTLRNKL